MLALGPADRAVRTSVHSAAVTYGCGIVENRQLTRATQADPKPCSPERYEVRAAYSRRDRTGELFMNHAI